MTNRPQIDNLPHTKSFLPDTDLYFFAGVIFSVTLGGG
jgi:hypothetical protein